MLPQHAMLCLTHAGSSRTEAQSLVPIAFAHSPFCSLTQPFAPRLFIGLPPLTDPPCLQRYRNAKATLKEEQVQELEEQAKRAKKAEAARAKEAAWAAENAARKERNRLQKEEEEGGGDGEAGVHVDEGGGEKGERDEGENEQERRKGGEDAGRGGAGTISFQGDMGKDEDEDKNGKAEEEEEEEEEDGDEKDEENSDGDEDDGDDALCDDDDNYEVYEPECDSWNCWPCRSATAAKLAGGRGKRRRSDECCIHHTTRINQEEKEEGKREGEEDGEEDGEEERVCVSQASAAGGNEEDDPGPGEGDRVGSGEDEATGTAVDAYVSSMVYEGKVQNGKEVSPTTGEPDAAVSALAAATTVDIAGQVSKHERPSTDNNDGTPSPVPSPRTEYFRIMAEAAAFEAKAQETPVLDLRRRDQYRDDLHYSEKPYPLILPFIALDTATPHAPLVWSSMKGSNRDCFAVHGNKWPEKMQVE